MHAHLALPRQDAFRGSDTVRFILLCSVHVVAVILPFPFPPEALLFSVQYPVQMPLASSVECFESQSKARFPSSTVPWYSVPTSTPTFSMSCNRLMGPPSAPEVALKLTPPRILGSGPMPSGQAKSHSTPGCHVYCEVEWQSSDSLQQNYC